MSAVLGTPANDLNLLHHRSVGAQLLALALILGTPHAPTQSVGTRPMILLVLASRRALLQDCSQASMEMRAGALNCATWST